MFLKNKIRKTPEYQELLRKCLRIKEICKGDASTNRHVAIYPIGIVEFEPLRTYANKSGKPNYDEKQLEFIFRANVYDSLIDRDIHEYLKLNSEKNFTKRDDLGIKIMNRLFGNNYKELLALTYYDVVDIIFDFIDYDDKRQDKILFHMKFHDFGMFNRISKNNESKVAALLMEDVNNDNYHILSSQSDFIGSASSLQFVQTANHRSIYRCTCGTKFAIPSDKKHVIANCPKCPKKWDIEQ